MLMKRFYKNDSVIDIGGRYSEESYIWCDLSRCLSSYNDWQDSDR